MLTSIAQKEWFRGLVFAFIIIGVALLLLAAQQYIDATTRLADNLAYQAQQEGEVVPLESQAEAQMLVGAGMEMRRLNAQQDRALMIGGGGLALLALGWIGMDFARARRRTTGAPAHSASG